ncbi:MAG TPA: DUF4402 domain-containing protein [Sphingomicrobium sp.]|nr:DUF4402 domain-containing protein [Sphingomicrobium sp.]
MANLLALGVRLLLAAALAAAATAPARAQCRLCEVPATVQETAVEADDVSLSIETTLDFDRVVLNGHGQGSAVIMPNGDRSTSGSVRAISGRAMVGTVIVRGDADRPVRVEFPTRVELYTVSGASIWIEDISSDLPADPKLDSAGNLSFRFGGKLTVSGDSDGDYRGDLPITVEYL